MPSRRLLFYTHGLVGGGAERVWALLASGFRARGHDVTLAVDFEADANRHLITSDIPVVVLGRSHATSVRALARLLRETRPDVALAAVGASNSKLLAARVLSRIASGVVLSAHGKIEAEYGVLGRATYFATPATSRLSDRTIAVSDDLRRSLIDRHGADPRKTVAIPNPVVMPDAADLPSAAALAARPPVVLAMGRLVPEKGMATLVSAMAASRRAQHLIVLGDGPQREALERLAAALGLADRVSFRGYVARPEPVFAEARMLALASQTEAFGNVLVEAMAHGLPVVSTRCGGPAEILAEGRHGRLVPVDDPIALAAAIDATLNDPGDPARHRARAETYALPAILDRYEALIEAVIAERAGQ